MQLNGELQPNVSRGLWLAKWFLAIPHYVVLIVLGIVPFLMTIIAVFTTLFIGRYPQVLFDFDVGMLRWAWKVGFNSYSVLGVDPYPSFILSEFDYPQTLDIPCPMGLFIW